MIELACFPYGVDHSDDGICLLVQMGPYRILLDCGLRDISILAADLHGTTLVDLVFCSHAHPDHARGLLAFHQAFPQTPIYASEVTTQLLPLNWWSEAEVTEVPLFCQALPWRSPVEFLDGLSAEIFPAGHLPGAAVLLLSYTPPPGQDNSPPHTYTILYTGDFFLSNSRLVEGLPLELLRGLRPDVLILEGTYGTARHPRRRQQENQLAERISRAIAEHQSVLLPTPALGFGQELLMLLRSHHLFTGKDLDIWVDGKVAVACDLYLELLSHLPGTVQNFAQHQPLFWDERVRPRVRRLHTPEQYEALGRTPCVVLTDENTGFSRYCGAGLGEWVLLLPQGENLKLAELAAQLASSPLEQGSSAEREQTTNQNSPGQDDLSILTPHSEGSNPFTSIETYLLAEHCDGAGTTQLIHNLRPQHVVFVHGSPTYLADLTSLEELQNRYHLHSPLAGTLVELPLGERAIQVLAPENNYEGELTETGTMVTITLPDAIMTDPRWQNFADTGLVEVRWQGEELVLRGLSQWELLSQGNDRALPLLDNSFALRECCANCQFYRGQRCWNQASPLSGFRVTPEGFCPVFAAKE